MQTKSFISNHGKTMVNYASFSTLQSVTLDYGRISHNRQCADSSSDLYARKENNVTTETEREREAERHSKTDCNTINVIGGNEASARHHIQTLIST